MDNSPIDPNNAPAPVVADTIQSLSGHNEGELLADGTTVKGDYDTAGKLVGWHKEPATEGTI
jgi:hypothetical protein